MYLNSNIINNFEKFRIGNHMRQNYSRSGCLSYIRRLPDNSKTKIYQ